MGSAMTRNTRTSPASAPLVVIRLAYLGGAGRSDALAGQVRRYLAARIRQHRDLEGLGPYVSGGVVAAGAELIMATLTAPHGTVAITRADLAARAGVSARTMSRASVLVRNALRLVDRPRRGRKGQGPSVYAAPWAVVHRMHAALRAHLADHRRAGLAKHQRPQRLHPQGANMAQVASALSPRGALPPPPPTPPDPPPASAATRADAMAKVRGLLPRRVGR
jgi:hypothetical protein